MDLAEFRKKFKEHFPKLNPNEYLDTLMWAATRKVSVDIVKLDDYFHEEFGDYEKQGYSMSDLVVKQFGKEVQTFLRRAMGEVK